jgi:hypothetical protein
MPQVVIANRLADGLVVFLGRDERWVEKLEDCLPAKNDEEAQRILAIGIQAEGEQFVVGSDLIEVVVREGEKIPVKMREAIRAKGPTVRRDLGKQAGY